MNRSFSPGRSVAALLIAAGLSVAPGLAQAPQASPSSSEYFDFFQEKHGVPLQGTPTKQGAYSLDRVLQCVPESLPSGIQLVNFDLAAPQGSLRPVGRDRCALTLGPNTDSREIAKLTGMSLYRANPGLGDYFAQKVPARADQAKVSATARFTDSFADRVAGVPKGRFEGRETPEAAAFWDQFKVEHGRTLEPEFPVERLPVPLKKEPPPDPDAGTGLGLFGVE